jgi:hypothetical protein
MSPAVVPVLTEGIIHVPHHHFVVCETDIINKKRFPRMRESGFVMVGYTDYPNTRAEELGSARRQHNFFN